MKIQTLASATSAALLVLAVSSPSLAAPAPAFLRDAVSGANAEIAVGRLAQQRSRSPAAIELGRTLERDHSAARATALQTARRLGIRLQPDRIKPGARAVQRRLARLSGARFDRAFAAAMVDDHRKDIAAFEDQRRRGDRSTSRYAADTLPHLRHHLDMAEQLERR